MTNKLTEVLEIQLHGFCDAASYMLTLLFPSPSLYPRPKLLQLRIKRLLDWSLWSETASSDSHVCGQDTWNTNYEAVLLV